VKLVDFSDAESFKLALEGTELVYCCVGTTQKNVKGDKELYRRIDFDIPVNAARFAKEAGASAFIIITSVGANSKSGQFYLKLKGEVEDEIIKNGPAAIHIMQPSMLLGKRTERRTGEKILQGVTKFISGIMFGSLRKYRAIEGSIVAVAMAKAGKLDKKGVFRYTYDDIRKMAELK
jgi:uncharacterized protein YbjT (DUF2867 family)